MMMDTFTPPTPFFEKNLSIFWGLRFPTLLAMSSFMSEFLSAVLEAHFSLLMNQGKTLIITQEAGKAKGDEVTLTEYGKF